MSKEKRITDLESKISNMEKQLANLRLRCSGLAEAGKNLAQLHINSAPLLDHLVRLAMYYEDTNDYSIPGETIQGYSKEAVEAYISRTGKAFAERVRRRSKQNRALEGDLGVGGPVVHRSQVDRIDCTRDAVNVEPETCAVAPRVQGVRHDDEVDSGIGDAGPH